MPKDKMRRIWFPYNLFFLIIAQIYIEFPNYPRKLILNNIIEAKINPEQMGGDGKTTQNGTGNHALPQKLKLPVIRITGSRNRCAGQ